MSHRRIKKDLKKQKKNALSNPYILPNKPLAAERRNIDALAESLKPFNQDALISALAGLQVVPSLQAHLVRLEVATRVATTLESSGLASITPDELELILNRHLPADSYAGMMDDPPEESFTTNIGFIGGNYIAFPGLTTGESYILGNLLQALDVCVEKAPEIGLLIYPTIIGALSLSNEVAIRLGYKRYQTSSTFLRERFNLPEEAEFHEFRSAVFFSKDDINKILHIHNLDWESISPLIVHVGDEQLLEGDIEANPLVLKPFVETDSGSIILASPCSVLTALRNYVLNSAKSLGMIIELLTIYSGIIWNNTLDCLSCLNFKPAYELKDIIHAAKDPLLWEAAFEIDTDKIAYVQFIPDIGYGFEYPDLEAMQDLTAEYNMAFLRGIEIKKAIELKYGIGKKMFIIRVISSIGRGIYVSSKQRPADDIELILMASDLDIISKHAGDRDSLALWKYAKLRNIISREVSISSTSFLDEYSFYLDNRHSFYFGDNRKFDAIQITCGYSKQLVETISKEQDEHVALIGKPSAYLRVSRYLANNDWPIYSPKSRFRERIELLVEGYYQPIWVTALEPRSDPEYLILASDMAETIAYWLWQITPSLRDLISPLGSEPISIRFKFDDLDKWLDTTNIIEYNESEPPTERVAIDENGFIYTMPEKIKKMAVRNDNLGERELVDDLLKGFGLLLEKRGAYPLEDTEKSRIINEHAPLGLKKKMLAINTGIDIALDPLDVSPERLVQEYDMSLQEDDLAKKLFGRKFQSRQISDSKEINDICNRAVDYYFGELRKQVKNLSWESALSWLIGNNEAILHQRAFWHFVTPPGIECFHSLEEAIERDVNKDPIRDLTAIANRTLVEYIAAEPPKGHEELSLEKLDELLGIASQLINWAMLSERVNLGLLDHKLVISESGHIRVESGELDSIWAPYYEIKTLEGIERSISEFDNEGVVSIQEMAPTGEQMEWDEAFVGDFGITMTDIIEFHSALIEIGQQERGEYRHGNMIGLFKRLHKELEWTDNKIELALSIFSLAPRGSFENIPDTFNDVDIYPWRYNRRLSYLRRPIIIGPEPLYNPSIYWGIKQVNESIKYLFYIIRSGRYINEAKSIKMKKLIGKIDNELSQHFVVNVVDWFRQNTEWIIDSEVPIGPKSDFESSTDLGDIDVLAIDPNKREIYSIECKKINSGRNAREIDQEIGKFVGGDRKSWIDKHLRRDAWLKNNFQKIQSKYNLSNAEFTIKSLIISSGELPSAYFHKMPMYMLSFTKLKRQGVAALRDS